MTIVLNRAYGKQSLRKTQNVRNTFSTRSTEKKFISFLSLLACGLLFSASAIAHHSTSKFDFKAFEVIRGTVKLMELRNPHSLVILEVKSGQDQVEEKVIAGHSVNIILRSELRHNMVSPGDEVTIIYAPSRTDDDMYMRAIQLSDGKLFTTGTVTQLSENELLELANRIKIKSE